jgi:hypothetical protein
LFSIYGGSDGGTVNPATLPITMYVDYVEAWSGVPY